MPQFFHGWRRKIGIAALVMACVLVVGWVRSLSTEDSYSVEMALGTIDIPQIISSDGEIQIWGWIAEHEHPLVTNDGIWLKMERRM